MDTYNLNGITVVAMLDNRRETNSGAYPVKIRVTYKRGRKYYSTGKNLTVSEWEKLEKTKNSDLLCIKKDLQYTYERVRDAVQSLENDGKFSFDALNTCLGKCVNETLNATFQAKIDSLIESGSIGNSITYSCSLKHLEKYAGSKITFDSITVDWLKKYEKEMLNEGKTYTTISMYIRSMRALFNEAKSAGVVKEAQYPFGKGKYEISTGKGRKMALTLQQIKQIITYTDEAEATEHYRDL